MCRKTNLLNQQKPGGVACIMPKLAKKSWPITIGLAREILREASLVFQLEVAALQICLLVSGQQY